MTKPEIEKLAREYASKLIFPETREYSKTIERDFKEGYLKGIEMERKRCLEICKDIIEKYIDDCKESKKYGINCAGYNMDMGSLLSAKIIKELIERGE